MSSQVFHHTQGRNDYPDISNLPTGDYENKPYDPPRNIYQNALLHAYLTWIAKETGNDMRTLKEQMKMAYACKKKYSKIAGKRKLVYILEETSKMSRKRFS